MDAGSAAAGRFSLVSVAGSDGFAAIGVVVREDSVDDDGSPIGGRGRIESSGSGLYELTELGVDVTRCVVGGHSGRGGSWGIFSDF